MTADPTATTATPGPPVNVTPDPNGSSDLVFIRHVAVQLALHRLKDGQGRPLLVLHGLGEATPKQLPDHLRQWPGPVWGLDFTGHGQSSVPGCGGYTAEMLVADTDHALAHLGPCTLYGRGLGAYIALLAAGARSNLVVGAVLGDGPGMDGGGPSPHSPMVYDPTPGDTAGEVPDPYALVDLSNDVRPADYALVYARQALEYSGLTAPLYVVAAVRPPWLQAVAEEPGMVITTLAEALTQSAAQK